MSHVWGLFSHPDREMQVINRENETISHHYTHHVLLMAAIPVICAFIGTTQIGWNFGDDPIEKDKIATERSERIKRMIFACILLSLQKLCVDGVCMKSGIIFA